MKILGLIVTLLSINVSAASFKTSDCQNTNWEEKGKFDGEQGHKIELLYK